MLDVFRAFLVFCLFLVLIRKNVFIGYVMMLSAAALFLLYRMNPGHILTTVKQAALSPISIKLLAALSLIRIFEIILREKNLLNTMMTSVKELMRSRRAVIISMPLLIGMLPSLGGAYFSAPMVKEATKEMTFSPEEKAFINYWFRHPWEYILPLYPGILLASAMSGIPLYHLAGANLAAAITMLATGFVFSMRGMGKRTSSEQSLSGDTHAVDWKRLSSFIPLLALLLMVMALRIELHTALIAAIVPLFLYFRYRPSDMVRLIRYGFAREVILLIFGIMLFKEAFESSGAVSNISTFFLEQQIPPLPVICVLPFIAGLLTGHTVGFVGSAFPLVLSLGGASLPVVSLAFCIGFAGVLLSPVHLCFVLTREYFKADLGGMYRRVIPAGLCVLAVVLLEYRIFLGFR